MVGFVVCAGCRQYVKGHERVCPFCRVTIAPPTAKTSRATLVGRRWVFVCASLALCACESEASTGPRVQCGTVTCALHTEACVTTTNREFASTYGGVDAGPPSVAINNGCVGMDASVNLANCAVPSCRCVNNDWCSGKAYMAFDGESWRTCQAKCEDEDSGAVQVSLIVDTVDPPHGCYGSPPTRLDRPC